MNQANPRDLMDQYLEAFKSRDLARCMSYFDPNARIEWMMGEYAGLPSIEEWHKDRFAAELTILHVDGFSVSDEQVNLDVVVQSKRLSAWRIPKIAGRVTAKLQDGKICYTKFSVKSINPQQNWA